MGPKEQRIVTNGPPATAQLGAPDVAQVPTGLRGAPRAAVPNWPWPATTARHQRTAETDYCNGHGPQQTRRRKPARDRPLLNNGIEFRRAERARWSLPNKELQLTSGTCCGRVEPLRGTTRWL